MESGWAFSSVCQSTMGSRPFATGGCRGISSQGTYCIERMQRVKTVLTWSKDSAENSEDGFIGFSVSQQCLCVFRETCPFEKSEKGIPSRRRRFTKACNYAC